MQTSIVAGCIGLMALVACSSADEGTSDKGTSDPTIDTGGSSGDDPSGGGFENGGGESPAGSDTCGDAVKDFVYVVSAERGLYRFAPDQRRFEKVGDLRCTDDANWAPNSMAIDRNGHAWVNYVQYGPDLELVAGAIYRVDIRDASCDSASRFALPAAWSRIGMGYATDAKGSGAETLYISSTAGATHGLARLDVAARKVIPGKTFTPRDPFESLSAELTGTGDARLYGMFISSGDGSSRPSPIVGAIDKSSSATASPVTMRNVEPPSYWAFSFWGGHFYLYTAPWREQGRTSNVTDYDPATGEIDPNFMTNVGFNIVGAGVSTCAPTTPPVH